MLTQQPVPLLSEEPGPTSDYRGIFFQAARRPGPRKELRSSPRRASSCSVWLVDREGQRVVRCRAENYSDTGLFVSAPQTIEFDVGQRYEVRVASELNASLPDYYAPSIGFATVRRTQPLHSCIATARQGVAVQLDLPQFLPV